MPLRVSLPNRRRSEALVARVKFDERGLVLVVAQEVDGTVLMVAWANREALLAVRTGRATYWSRSRRSG